MNVLANELSKMYEEVSPMDFYRDIFPEGELDGFREYPEQRTEHRYTGIIVEVIKKNKEDGMSYVKRHTVTDDLDEIDSVLWTNNFCIMSPISYAGKARTSVNARVMYALCVEIDNLLVGKDGTQRGLHNLIGQWSEQTHWVPRPTYTVASGNGLHLYYLFEKGIPLFPDVVKRLHAFKHELTKMLWNRHVTIDYEEDKIQFESIFQGFRMVGTITKRGDRVHAFRTGERVSIDYMNSFILSDTKKKRPNTLLSLIYKSDLTLDEAKKKYPEWYERRIVQKQPKGYWICKRDLYDWWRKKIEEEAAVGHRYYCMMMLSIYAIKCGISYEELEKDCFELAEVFEGRTKSEDNHFTFKDVVTALQSFEDRGLITYPVSSISYYSGIPIEKNKRNGLNQTQHLYLARRRKEDMKAIGLPMKAPEGRPSAEQVVKAWRENHPDGKKADCIRETGLSKPTVYKWWS